MNKIFKYYQGPSHGWVEVPIEDIRDLLTIEDKISKHSYKSIDGETAYLEEDCDFGIFLKEYEKQFSNAIILINNYPVNEESFIRKLPHYKNY